MQHIVLTFNLPFPISVNAMYKSIGKRRAPSKRYNEWKVKADAMILPQRSYGLLPLPVQDHVEVSITVQKKDKRRRDLDNMIKCCLDAIERNGIIEDDSLVQKITIQYGQVKDTELKIYLFDKDQ